MEEGAAALERPRLEAAHQRRTQPRAPVRRRHPQLLYFAAFTPGAADRAADHRAAAVACQAGQRPDLVQGRGGRVGVAQALVDDGQRIGGQRVVVQAEGDFGRGCVAHGANAMR